MAERKSRERSTPKVFQPHEEPRRQGDGDPGPTKKKGQQRPAQIAEESARPHQPDKERSSDTP